MPSELEQRTIRVDWTGGPVIDEMLDELAEQLTPRHRVLSVTGSRNDGVSVEKDVDDTPRVLEAVKRGLVDGDYADVPDADAFEVTDVDIVVGDLSTVTIEVSV